MRSPAFRSEAYRQSLAIATSPTRTTIKRPSTRCPIGVMNEAQLLKRGDIWTVAGGKDNAGKPRPVVIVQDDSFDATDSITVCACTTDETAAPLFRLAVEPRIKRVP